ncbi:MAG: D-alanyl-D-alanine carboxypeptidase/D-alanyl-D-alanine-endopeptidase [Rikenellaceae bacterium]|jgi:D-alanyl-D-alanine carboxypeptidase/D-alanyl-D-alanine-endopeptidase (penicillin-binding protein 4)
MKKPSLFLLIFLILASSFNLSAKNRIVQKCVNQMKKDTLFSNSVVGIMVMDSKGKCVASWNPDSPLLTASTMKTISTGLALQILGPDYRFKTRIGYSGQIENGVLNGDLYIVGGGDPTLGSKDTVAIPVDTVFSQWYKFIRAAGIVKINGSIVGDDRFFEEEALPDTWSWSNIGASYGSAASGLSFCENIQYFTFIPGEKTGEPVVMKDVYPSIPGMEYRNMLKTGISGSGDRSSYYVSDLAKVGVFKGTLGAGKESYTVDCSSKFPALMCAEEFRLFLIDKGIESNPDVKDVRSFDATDQDQLNIIGETLSPRLISIVNVTNRISNNFYAETFFKMIGKQLTGTGSYDSSVVAAKRELSKMGLSLKGYTQVDGSGLSRQNYVSPRFFCKYFARMKEMNNFVEFIGSLPQPGGPGTLKSVLKDADSVTKSKIHAKSGSLSNVKCYAGYVEKRDGEYDYFAILTNNYQARTSEIQAGVERFLGALVDIKETSKK